MKEFVAYENITEADIDELTSTNKPIVLFGAMCMGLYAKKALDFLNIKPTCFCDNSTTKQGTLIEGIPVLSPLQLKEQYPQAKIYVCSFKPRNVEIIKKQLEELGLRDINSKDILYDVYIKNCSNRFNKASDVDNLLDVFKNPQNKLILKLMNLVVTTKCTLKCKHCNSLVPYFENSHNIVKDIILSSICRCY